MSFDLLSATPQGPGPNGYRVVFPYPAGRVASDYLPSGAYLTAGEASYSQDDDVFSVIYEAAGAEVVYRSAPTVTAGVTWILKCPLTMAADLKFGATARAPGGSRAPLIAFAGDSVTAATTVANTSLITMNAQRGMQFWVPFLLKRRIRTRVDLNFGVSGNTSAALRDRIGAVCACDADYVLVQIGTNDIGVLTYEETIANLEAIWSSLLAAGKFVIALPPLPRSLADADDRGQLNKTIRYVEEKRFAGLKNFVAISTAAAYVDPTSATGAPKSGYTYDSVLHPTARGEYYTSLPVVEYLDKLLPPAAATFWSVADVFSADNPTGNLIANGLLDGTGGTLGGLDSGASAGSFATSFQYSVSDNGGVLGALTHTGTKITHPVDGRPGQRIRIEGTGYTGAGSATLNASSACLFNQIFASFTGFSIGDTIRGRGEIIKAATATECLTGLELHLFMTMGGQTNRRADGSSFGDRLPVETFSGTFETPPITLTAVPTAVQFGIRAYLANGVNTIDSSFDIYGLKLEKVV